MKRLTLFCLVILSIGSLLAQPMEVNRKKIKAIVTDWNTAHNEHDYVKFGNLYADEVLFYCQSMSREQCLNNKAKLFKKYPDFDQQIISNDLILTAYSEERIKCEFTKKVRANKKIREYPSYLILIKSQGNYLITGESDRITDHNLKYTLELGIPVRIVDEVDQPESLPEPDSDTFSSFLLILGLLIGLIALTGILRKLFSGYNKKTAIPTRKLYDERKIVRDSFPNSLPYSAPTPVRTHVSFAPEKNNTVVIGNQAFTKEEIGRMFEEFAALKFRTNPYFKFKDWRSDKFKRGVYAESNQYPDLQYEFRLKDCKIGFAVECKFKSKKYDNIILVDIEQIDRYRNFQSERKMKVFILLGLGGFPDAPNELFIIPLNDINVSEHAMSMVEDVECLIVSYEFVKKYRKQINTQFFFDQHTMTLT